MDIKDYVDIVEFKLPALKKCGSCGRNREIYYEVHIKDFVSPGFVISNISMCKPCGENVNKIFNVKQDLGEKVIKNFDLRL